jgi:hypothetical protein
MFDHQEIAENKAGFAEIDIASPVPAGLRSQHSG